MPKINRNSPKNILVDRKNTTLKGSSFKPNKLPSETKNAWLIKQRKLPITQRLNNIKITVSKMPPKTQIQIFKKMDLIKKQIKNKYRPEVLKDELMKLEIHISNIFIKSKFKF